MGNHFQPLDQAIDEWWGPDEPEDDDEDGDDGWSECGRWDNGRLSPQCRKAGSEECDWECPIGLARKRVA